MRARKIWCLGTRLYQTILPSQPSNDITCYLGNMQECAYNLLPRQRVRMLLISGPVCCLSNSSLFIKPSAIVASECYKIVAIEQT